MAILAHKFKSYFMQAGIACDEHCLSQTEKFVNLLEKFNKTHNLTAIIDTDEIIVKHIIDSAMIGQYLQGQDILDVGTGAGLPGIILAILMPSKKFVLLDAVLKKINFVEHAIVSLNLTNAKAVHARIENYQDKCDTIICRAFASTKKLLSATKHLSKSGIRLINMQGATLSSEDDALPVQTKVVDYVLPVVGHQRKLVIIDSIS